MKIAITCTSPRCDEIVTRLNSHTIDACAMPALQVQRVHTPEPSGNFDAILITSRHAVIDDLPDLPVIAVGTYTANILRDKGHNVVQIGTGGGVDDLDLSNYTSILYPCAVAPTSIPDNAVPWPVYETTQNSDFAIAPDTKIIAVFSIKGAGVIHSMINNSNLKFICLSQAVADALGEINADRLAVCAKPTYDNIEKLIREESQK